MIRAVVLDLDDTLYPQAQWLEGAWDCVCRAGATYGVDPQALRPALLSVAAEGSAKGRIIDRALARLGAADVPVGPLVAAFRSYTAPRLSLFPGAASALTRLRSHVRIGLVTDGDTAIQRGKLRALRLEDAFDVVVLSDDLGRHRRKPDPAPFRLALANLGVTCDEAVSIGDHPEKDVLGPYRAGIRAVRVLTGEYAAVPSRATPWATAANIVEAVDIVSNSSRETDVAPEPRTTNR